MWDIKACAVCFNTEGKLHSLDDALRTDFNTVSGLETVQGNGMPEYLCVECKAFVEKFKSFRGRCHRAYYVLHQMLLKDKEIKLSHLTSINRQQLKIMPTLSYLPVVQFTSGAEHLNEVVEPPKQIKIETENGYIKIVPQTTRNDTLNSSDNSKTLIELVPNSMQIEFETPIAEPETQISIPFNHNTKLSTQMELELETNEQTQIPEFDNKFEDNLDSFDNNDSDNEPLENDVALSTDDALNLEYATLVPITPAEARAVIEVNKFTSTGDYECKCGMRCPTELNYKRHVRKHNKCNGEFHCNVCSIYFKSAFVLECHLKNNHMFKYICKKCPYVNFTRTLAKEHYVNKHINGNNKRRKIPKWIPRKRFTRKEEIAPPPPPPTKPKKAKKLPKDYPAYSPISQEEQYKIVEARKKSRNYLEANYKCEFCYRGYRLSSTYNKHMAKHDPKISGPLQCDMCKLYFKDMRKMYKHMISYHLFKYSCRHCDFVCFSKCIALYHYRWHNNVVYDCPHCDRKFNKISTQLTHIRFKHPTTFLCNICGHSFISSGGLNFHKHMSHSKEEIELSSILSSSTDNSSQLYCSACDVQFYNLDAYTIHLTSSSKHVDTNIAVNRSESQRSRIERAAKGGSSTIEPRNRGRPRRSTPGSEIINNGTTTANNCEVCGVYLSNDVAARKHYESEHPGTDYLKRYMCHICGHTTKQHANLLVHMRVHTQEKPYSCPHCDRKFSMPSNRDRHLVVHTGEKRFECQHCFRRFTQSTAVKLHIQTVHMKIPYKPWDKKNRKRRKEMEPNTQTGLTSVVAPPAPAPAPVTQHKILLDPQAEYITYIAFADH